MHKWRENYVKTGVTGEPGSNLRLLGCSDTTEADVRELAVWFNSSSVLMQESITHLLPSLPMPWRSMTADQLTLLAQPVSKRKQRRTQR